MKPFTTAAVIVFLVVAIVQLVRVIEGWDVTIDGFHVPILASIVAFLFATVLAVTVWRENRRRT